MPHEWLRQHVPRHYANPPRLAPPSLLLLPTFSMRPEVVSVPRISNTLTSAPRSRAIQFRNSTATRLSTPRLHGALSRSHNIFPGEAENPRQPIQESFGHELQSTVPRRRLPQKLLDADRAAAI